MDAACSLCGRRLAFRRGLCVDCYRQSHQAVPDRRKRPSADVIEDVEWMIATGETHPETIAARLGLRTNSVFRALKRGGRDDLADILRARKREDDQPHASGS